MATLLRIDAETLPRILVLDPPMTDKEIEALCRDNDGVQFKRTKEGAIRMKPPAGGRTVGQAVEIRKLKASSTNGAFTNLAEYSILVAVFACPTDRRSVSTLLICRTSD